MGLKSFFKRRGFSVVLAMAMGLVSEWVVPAILIKIGLSYLLPVSMITPWSFMYLSIPNAIDKTLLKRKITKELGGKLQYQAYKAQRQATYDVLKLSNPDQLILPLAQENNVIHAVVIPKQSTWNSLLTKIGLHPKKLNYQSLKLFLKEHNLEDNYAKWISGNPDFDKSIKVYLIVHHILKNDNEEITSNFKLKFSNHFVSVQNDVNWDVMKNWSKRMLLAPSIEDANILLKQVPEGTSVNEVLQLWQKMFLPEYASRLS
ncbi:hypothetical protein OAT67_04865, partial [Bacteriovoracaceae bacterium]|nr:hypothetical protein [Bacteriovoracaceae bacterium]